MKGAVHQFFFELTRRILAAPDSETRAELQKSRTILLPGVREAYKEAGPTEKLSIIDALIEAHRLPRASATPTRWQDPAYVSLLLDVLEEGAAPLAFRAFEGLQDHIDSRAPQLVEHLEWHYHADRGKLLARAAWAAFETSHHESALALEEALLAHEPSRWLEIKSRQLAIHLDWKGREHAIKVGGDELAALEREKRLELVDPLRRVLAQLSIGPDKGRRSKPPVSFAPMAAGVLPTGLRMRFLSEQEVEVVVGGVQGRYSFIDMGMGDRRTRPVRPDKRWMLLRLLAKNGGLLKLPRVTPDQRAKGNTQAIRLHEQFAAAAAEAGAVTFKPNPKDNESLHSLRNALDERLCEFFQVPSLRLAKGKTRAKGVFVVRAGNRIECKFTLSVSVGDTSTEPETRA